MNKLTLKIEYSDFFNNDLVNYLLSLRGVKLATIINESNEICVEYDSSIIPLKILKMEMLLYLDITKKPSIISFDKHTKNNKNYTIIINDLCCEYCLNSMIDELLEIEGIESAYTDFDYINKYNVKIFIKYNNKLITKNKLVEIKNKLNNNY